MHSNAENSPSPPSGPTVQKVGALLLGGYPFCLIAKMNNKTFLLRGWTWTCHSSQSNYTCPGPRFVTEEWWRTLPYPARKKILENQQGQTETAAMLINDPEVSILSCSFHPTKPSLQVTDWYTSSMNSATQTELKVGEFLHCHSPHH